MSPGSGAGGKIPVPSTAGGGGGVGTAATCGGALSSACWELSACTTSAGDGSSSDASGCAASGAGAAAAASVAGSPSGGDSSAAVSTISGPSGFAAVPVCASGVAAGSTPGCSASATCSASIPEPTTIRNSKAPATIASNPDKAKGNRAGPPHLERTSCLESLTTAQASRRRSGKPQLVTRTLYSEIPFNRSTARAN